MWHTKTQLRALGIVLGLALCFAGGFSASAHADPGDNGRGYGHQSDNGDNRHDNGNNNPRAGGDHARPVINIEDNDRQVIRTYMQGHHHHHNHLPPGQVRRYEVGQRLPTQVTYVMAPYSLRRHLRPAQPGYEYVRVDDDVLLMSKNDRTIIDAVSLLSDLSH